MGLKDWICDNNYGEIITIFSGRLLTYHLYQSDNNYVEIITIFSGRIS